MSSFNSRAKCLLPTDVVLANGSVYVHLIDPERMDLSRGFFKYALPEDRPVEQFMRLKDWVEANANANAFDGS